MTAAPIRHAPPHAARAGSGLFRSFWMGGYEGADHINSAGRALSMNEATEHWARLDEDYAMLADFGIRTVRESIGWRVTELQGQPAIEALQQRARLADHHGIEVVWTLMHYGWPADLNLLSPAFVDRFAAFSEKIARALRAVSGETRFYQPVNEISFLAWALSSTGMMRHPMADGHEDKGDAIKRQLVRAALRACEAVGLADPGARFMHSDPVMGFVAPQGGGAAAQEAVRRTTDYGFEAWDMLCGKRAPELGGSMRHLDVVGVNYYATNQWEFGTGQGLHWHLRDPRRIPFCELLEPVWHRYGRPMLIAETSHVGEGRGPWLDDMAKEVLQCCARGMPVEGLCLYPIIDRHDWDDAQHWHHSGLWDVQAFQSDGSAGSLERTLCHPYAERLRHWQRYLPGGTPHSLQTSESLTFI